jgi:hypothetical protein
MPGKNPEVRHLGVSGHVKAYRSGHRAAVAFGAGNVCTREKFKRVVRVDSHARRSNIARGSMLIVTAA